MSATRVISPAGLALIQQWEGLALAAYRDIAGVWTIGWGHTGGVYKGQVITQTEALQLLMADLSVFEAFVAARTDPAATSDSQFAAMVSLAYNIGTGGFLGSTVLRDHKAGDFQGAAAAFLLWDKARVDGQLVVVKGLLNRRIAEAALYSA